MLGTDQITKVLQAATNATGTASPSGFAAEASTPGLPFSGVLRSMAQPSATRPQHANVEGKWNRGWRRLDQQRGSSVRTYPPARHRRRPLAGFCRSAPQ